MREALVFQGANNLNFHDIRQNVIRIPEVLTRVHQAQRMWDTACDQTLDLVNFIGSDDGIFSSNIQLKNFAGSIVQVGLLDRYLKFYKLPEYLVGLTGANSPLLVAAGKISFFDMIVESPLIAQPVGLPGIKMDQFGIFRGQPDGSYEPLVIESPEISPVVTDLINKHEVNRLIVIGPGNSIYGPRLMDITSRDVQVAESIDLDPMLSWFWSTLKSGRLAIA